MDEFSWIRVLRDALALEVETPWGIGDDAAVLNARAHDRVIATDLMVEGVHFRRDWSSLEDIAFKLFASNASDMWAMGAAPTEWLLNVAFPARPSEADARALVRGFKAAMQQWGPAPLIGGDTSTSSGPLMLSATMLGAVRETPWVRSGFLPGDTLWVDGPLGWAAAGLQALSQQGPEADAWASEFVLQQRRPQRQPACYDFAARGAIDISDGLSVDLMHAARASSVRMVLQHELPGRAALAALLQRWPESTPASLEPARGTHEAQLDAWQVAGGEDYVRVVGSSMCPGTGWHAIGFVEAGPPSLFDERRGTRQELRPQGWNHFAASFPSS